ncbi:RNA-binding S4 domain-containing protein [Vibrio algarum]|uniref:RNA-binding S4 domain-containing protein n=1 Tax=Vibrio algarum TaxID=3020714 RepID=A0ABT4YVL7_9VIBR|nr:RNA-binding S4 domain-containing protein [Vibrio sp. KJ40-1]MDB1125432.1 RNA-binding S4 domain-containing protein [Vibrio sp. KJ40-1]
MYEEQPDDLASDEVEIEAIGIEVNSQPIELYKIFKIANLVNGGGEAKHIISEGYVAVNGEIETRKRRKMYDGDLVEFNQEYYVILCDLPEGELPEVFEEDMVAHEYQVSDMEVESIEQNAADEFSQVEKEELPLEMEESESEKPKVEQEEPEKKDNGRKSIQFF